MVVRLNSILVVRCGTSKNIEKHAHMLGDVQNIEGHHSITDKGGRPHGYGNFAGAMWSPEGARVVFVIVRSVAWYGVII